MLKLIKENNINMRVDSAGTSNFHVNEAPDKRTIVNAAKHDVDLKPLRARQFKASDFEKFDQIYVMDKSNLSNVLALASSEEHKAKVNPFTLKCECRNPMPIPIRGRRGAYSETSP